jgi:site-specific DNA-methyltransferase (adenine-specific)
MKLIQGDSLDIIKKCSSGKVDCIITDPPYGMDFQSNYRGVKYNKIANDTSLAWLADFMGESFRVLKHNTHMYCFCSFHKVDLFKQAMERHFKIKNILIWEKNNTSMGDLKGDYAPKYEMILYGHKGRRALNGGRDANIMQFKRTGNKLHPTEKPVDLIEYLVGKSTQKGELVFDPFMGSGTTGVACKNLGRDFVGIELDSTYYGTARQRIEEA